MKFPPTQQRFVEIYTEFYPKLEEECRKCERRFQTAFRNMVSTAATIQISHGYPEALCLPVTPNFI
jgi:hypothetical protein